MSEKKEFNLSTDYEYGFHDEDVSVFNTGRGINEEVVRTISAAKHEPEWMLDIRLKAYHYFAQEPNPDWGPDLTLMTIFTILIQPKRKNTTGRKFLKRFEIPLIN